jgi:membrane protease YdiL (CAAX protease family)
VWSALVFGLVFPTAISVVEAVAASPETNGHGLTAIVYGAGKMVQFGLPLLCLVWFGSCIRPGPARPGGWTLAAGFGLVVAAGILGLYYGFLRETPLFAEAAARVHDRLTEFGLNSPAGLALFAFFIAVVHSLLEEYYWRWFLFAWLEREMPVGLAVVLSSVAFMVPHAFALATFLGATSVLALAAFTLCVGIGGAVWAWIFYRSHSLGPPWLSHFLVDAALFVVGYDLFFRTARCSASTPVLWRWTSA